MSTGNHRRNIADSRTSHPNVEITHDLNIERCQQKKSNHSLMPNCPTRNQSIYFSIGHHDYMKHLFASIGCAVEIHVKPGDWRTWDMRWESGFSLCTLMEHHWYYNEYVTKTGATRVSDQVFFLTQVHHKSSNITQIARRSSSTATYYSTQR